MTRLRRNTRRTCVLSVSLTVCHSQGPSHLIRRPPNPTVTPRSATWPRKEAQAHPLKTPQSISINIGRKSTTSMAWLKAAISKRSRWKGSDSSHWARLRIHQWRSMSIRLTSMTSWHNRHRLFTRGTRRPWMRTRSRSIRMLFWTQMMSGDMVDRNRPESPSRVIWHGRYWRTIEGCTAWTTFKRGSATMRLFNAKGLQWASRVVRCSTSRYWSCRVR